uniref:Cytochrome c domain-containing protein n=1 Tax=Steinernema glaseri TaxID=37863 RepID=A0A1I7Z067_9BILA
MGPLVAMSVLNTQSRRLATLMRLRPWAYKHSAAKVVTEEGALGNRMQRGYNTCSNCHELASDWLSLPPPIVFEQIACTSMVP